MNPANRRKYLYPAITFWLIVEIFYALAWRAGFVTDAIDWLHEANTLPLAEYLNRSHSTIHALYQTTQLITLGFYKLFGTARLPWHLLFTTMHAGVAYLLYLLCGNLFKDASLRRPRRIAFWGTVLFCLCPYCPEVLVWKACFHYLQALLLLFGILRCVQDFIYAPRPAMPWLAAGLFVASIFSLEVFYLTPCFTASILLYYGRLGWNGTVLRRAWRHFLLPQLLMIACQLVIFHHVYGEWASHGTGGALAFPLRQHLIKGAQYSFHLLFFGRFWPQLWKECAYGICEKTIVLIVSYGMLLALLFLMLRKAHKGYGRDQVGLLLMSWMLLAVAMALPMSLDHLFDLSGNRYLYPAAAVASMLLALLGDALPRRWMMVGLVGLWAGLSAFLTLRTVRHWQTSERIVESLLTNVPPSGGRTTILLSMPYCYKGIPMINAWPSGNFARMREVLYSPLPQKVWDGAAFNMAAPTDGSRAEIVNDSTIKVTLNQWGTWWWYQDFGAYNYETPDYRVDMRDPGHWYQLILKRPRQEFQLLYQNADRWQELP